MADADTIKIGNTDISAFKVGSGDCTIYLGDTLLYPQGPTPPAFQCKWKATYIGGTTSSAECDSSSEIVNGDVTKTNLVSVEIGDCVTSIGDYAFDGCRSLSSITIPNSITTIGTGGLSFNGLIDVVLPDSVTSIGYQGFWGCSSLTSVTIGSGITYIEWGVFDGCTNLTSFTIKATTPPTIKDNYILQDSSSCIIYVPSGSVNAYKTANKWSNYADRIQAIPNS